MINILIQNMVKFLLLMLNKIVIDFNLMYQWLLW
jgi:hypothetical protein